MLNVTSLNWLDTTKAHGPQGSIWSHQLLVIVPKNLRTTNVSMAWITDGCNEEPNKKQGPFSDYNTLIADEIAYNSGAVTVSIMQIPNCPLVFPHDPTHSGRSEDALLGQSWLEFLNDPDDPEWLIWLPMIKASY